MLSDLSARYVNTDSWLFRPARRSRAVARLFCFSHAGGTATNFRLWPNGLPPELEVCALQLPGHGTRVSEAPITSIVDLVEALHSVLRPHFDLPFAFFGHSMGAVLAHELAKRLLSHGDPLPRHLIVSGRPAPSAARSSEPISHLPGADFVEEMDRRYGGIPVEVREHAELLALVLPGLRADMRALETFEPSCRQALPCPLTAYGGTDDPGTPLPDLEAWCAETTGPLFVRMFPGDHFYLNLQRQHLVADVAARLAPMLREARAYSA